MNESDERSKQVSTTMRGKRTASIVSGCCRVSAVFFSKRRLSNHIALRSSSETQPTSLQTHPNHKRLRKNLSNDCAGWVRSLHDTVLGSRTSILPSALRVPLSASIAARIAVAFSSTPSGMPGWKKVAGAASGRAHRRWRPGAAPKATRDGAEVGRGGGACECSGDTLAAAMTLSSRVQWTARARARRPPCPPFLPFAGWCTAALVVIAFESTRLYCGCRLVESVLVVEMRRR